MNIVFDLDGTLLDSRRRLYVLFQRLVPGSLLSFDEYWSLKRNGTGHETILLERFGIESVELDGFLSRWLALIESKQLLALDTVINNVPEALAKLGQKADLHVCTARQSGQKAITQLEDLNLLHYFSSVLVTGTSHTKLELINRIPSLSSDDWIVTDTGQDIRVGQALGIKTCAVLTGFLSEARLRGYRPNRIVPSVANFNLDSTHHP